MAFARALWLNMHGRVSYRQADGEKKEGCNTSSYEYQPASQSQGLCKQKQVLAYLHPTQSLVVKQWEKKGMCREAKSSSRSRYANATTGNPQLPIPCFFPTPPHPSLNGPQHWRKTAHST